jgi:hypothetical protein
VVLLEALGSSQLHVVLKSCSLFPASLTSVDGALTDLCVVYVDISYASTVITANVRRSHPGHERSVVTAQTVDEQ